MMVIVDYGMGNLRSISHRLERMGIKNQISGETKVIAKADRIILPGVGYFAQAMENLKNRKLINILNQKVIKEKTPILGICLGMQLFAEFSEEGEAKGLGWIKGRVQRFSDTQLKIPHMGWNNVKFVKSSPLFEEIKNNSEFYFVHSYHFEPKEAKSRAAVTKYGQEFCSIVSQGNIFGVQFHPEKSRLNGVELLKNFSKLENKG